MAAPQDDQQGTAPTETSAPALRGDGPSAASWAVAAAAGATTDDLGEPGDGRAATASGTGSATGSATGSGSGSGSATGGAPGRSVPASRAATAGPAVRAPRSPAAMAALLVAAMPGTAPVAVAPAHAGRDDVDAALVHDAEGGVWVVTAPRSAAAGARVDAETEAVRLLAGVLPFDVPRPRADVPLPEGGRAIVFPAPRGRPVDLVRLAASPGVCRSVGRSLAALHDVTTAVVERAGVPVRDAGEVRRRRLDELDRGAQTSQVPPVLLERWEAVLDDTSLWDFSPTVVHGDLVAERLVVTGEEVTAVLDWTDLHVGDPAEDLAWLAVGAEPETVAEVLQAYRSSRHGSVDDDLLRRAVLHGEMALVRWLLHGVTTDDADVREDARGMLDQLAGWVEAENAARHQDEEDARIADEDARLAEEDARLAEEDARLAEEDARLAEEDARLAEEDARLAVEDARLAEDDARAAGEDVADSAEEHPADEDASLPAGGATPGGTADLGADDDTRPLVRPGSEGSEHPGSATPGSEPGARESGSSESSTSSRSGSSAAGPPGDGAPGAGPAGPSVR